MITSPLYLLMQYPIIFCPVLSSSIFSCSSLLYSISHLFRSQLSFVMLYRTSTCRIFSSCIASWPTLTPTITSLAILYTCQISYLIRISFNLQTYSPPFIIFYSRTIMNIENFIIIISLNFWFSINFQSVNSHLFIYIHFYRTFIP